MDAITRQGIVFQVGNRSGRSIKALWQQIPALKQEQATFYTDQYEVHRSIIPLAQHHTISKRAWKTNQVERFNCPLRQRVARLVRATLSFSKQLRNHLEPSAISLVRTTSPKVQYYQDNITER